MLAGHVLCQGAAGGALAGDHVGVVGDLGRDSADGQVYEVVSTSGCPCGSAGTRRVARCHAAEQVCVPVTAAWASVVISGLGMRLSSTRVAVEVEVCEDVHRCSPVVTAMRSSV